MASNRDNTSSNGSVGQNAPVPKHPIKPLKAITYLLKKDVTSKSKLFKVDAGKLWDITNPIAIEFIVEIEKRFRNKSKRYGYFSSTKSSIPKELTKYYTSNNKKIDSEFLSFSNGLAVSLGHAADEVNASPTVGGNVIIMHYTSHEDGDLGRILIVLLDKKSMFNFDDDLRPERLEPIDTRALKQAALFDINLFSVSTAARDTDPYLKFIEGSSKAAFFKEALGCDEKVDNEKSVSEVNRSIRDFIAVNKIDLTLAEEIRDGVKALLIQHSRTNSEPLSVDAIQRRIDQLLPENSVYKNTYSDFAHDNEYQISEWFQPTSYHAKKIGKITISDENKSYEAEVSENSIGEMGSNKPVKISSDGDYICFPISGEKRKEIFRATGRYEEDKNEE